MLAETDGERWVFRRDHRITGAISSLGRTTPDGLPFVAPEIQLLYKANPSPLAKDEQSFGSAAPLLAAEQRAWLRDALATVAPMHPWRARPT